MQQKTVRGCAVTGGLKKKTYVSEILYSTTYYCASLLAGESSEVTLIDCCTPVSEVAGRRQLRSAS